MIHTTPKEVTEKILKFCREKIDPTTKPVFLTLDPIGNCISGDCFGNVEDYIKKKGGRVQYGWIIWESPKYLLEAEFHAIWVNDDEEYIDITPKVDGEKEILFFPDSKRKDTGGITPNIINKRKIGVNDPCSCGKKYKKCCMGSDQ